jgi:tetratricopeptide (TPR) repeat protein
VKTIRRIGSATVQQNICSLVIFILLFTAGFSYPLSAQQKPSRQSSLEAFSRGDYELAYSEFSELLVSFPRDPLYKYYSAVCLVNLKRDPGKAVVFLKEALQNAAVLRSIPPDAVFWLGRAQHMAGLFEDAVNSYNAFTEQSGRKAAKELGVPIYIQQCSEKEGNIKQPENEPPGIGVDTADIGIIVKKDSSKAPHDVQIAVSKKADRDTISGDYDHLLSEALQYQLEADSLQKIIETQKGSIEKLSYKEKSDLRMRIAVSENLADSLQNMADIRFDEAQDIMNKTPFVAAEEKKDSTPASPSVKEPVKVPQKQQDKDTSATEVKKIVPSPAFKQENIYSYFEVIPKPVYKEGEKVQINPDIPPGLIYRIQVAVFRNPVAPAYFKGISPVYGFKVTGKDLTVYYAGMFRKLADATKALASVKQKGFKDAFVTSFHEGKAVSPERAAILEKEWGRKPFVSVSSAMPETPADTVPPTLSFRVEVMRSKKPVKDDVVEGIMKMAGTRGLETVQLSDGTSVYLIGMFITYESAEEYSDLLVRNGYREARVAAWLGKKEIPVEAARELFDRLK